MEKPDFSKYLDYAELTKWIRSAVEENRDLSRMYSIGKTYEGREMWMVEIGARSKGCPDERPAIYIDGNHHAGEVTGSEVCLYTIWYLLSRYGKDSFVTHLVDTKTWYILPRISIDGAELFLHTPYQVRSSVREWPPSQGDAGLNPEDVDGDGWILEMRIPDEDGDWKVSDKDSRLMVRREPWDEEGPFYRVYPEGILKNWDGGEIKIAKPKWGLDINRNYPANWEPELTQHGAGPYPLSEPETRNVANFIISHPNIGAAMSYHTTMGAILRPSCTKPDSKLPPEDVAMYRTIGSKGTEITGCPCVSTYEDYTWDKEHPLKGVFMDWLYEHQGIMTFSTELWDASVRAGNKLFDRRGRTAEENQLALLRWNDREIAGQGFVNWHKFKHPQLGEVEIGGWKSKFVLTNPPPQFLEGECHKNCMFTLYHAACLPELRIEETSVRALSPDLYSVKAVVVNKGFLPTSTCRMAEVIGKARPVVIEIEPAESDIAGGRTADAVSVIAGDRRQELGQLEGFLGGARRGVGWYARSSQGGRKEATWIVHGEKGSRIKVKVSSVRAGVDERTIALE